LTAPSGPYHGDESDQREFVDVQGRRWTVTEDLVPRPEWSSAEAEAHRAGYPVGWLYFRCDTEQRRLRLFPSAWQTLSDVDLERLCGRARVVA
jgi:hypothetical protein